MEIVNCHYKCAKPVTSYKEISAQVSQMKEFMRLYANVAQGYFNKVYALAHSEVSETPFNFFVFSPEVVNEGLMPCELIINPEILEMPIYIKKGTLEIENLKEVAEPCVSFAFRQPKKVFRYNYIKVRFARLNWLKRLKYEEKELTGIISGMFQHLLEHNQGQSLYYYNPSPVKWWELIGTSKSIGGNSLEPDKDTPPPPPRLMEKK